MRSDHKHFLIVVSLTLIIVLVALFSLNSTLGSSAEPIPAPDFEAADLNGVNFSLSDFEGEVVVLHITNIESPLCVECEKTLAAQIGELQRLVENKPDVKLITLNVRKNPYSKDGMTLSQSWWDADVSWIWAEDFEPYEIASKYVDFTNFEGGFSNPTILLIDRDGMVAGVYHVYQLGRGEIDGIQDAEALQAKVEALERGEWAGMEGSVSIQNITFLGMFGLGVITSFSPCSLALLIAMFSYIVTSRRKRVLSDDQDYGSSSREGLLIGVAFTLGMAIVFFVVGLFISNLGVFVRDSRFFDLAAGVLLVVLGINVFKPIGEILEPIKARLPSRGEEDFREKKGFMERAVNLSIGLFKHSVFIGAFTLGVFFALGWAPCAVSLVFPALIWLMSQDISDLTGGLMLFVFGVCHRVPIIPIVTISRSFGGKMGEEYLPIGKWVVKFFGLMIIVTGLVFAARYFGYKLW
ncbi:MAG: cytochrome c biogenesis protein [Methanothrix harundinacea]|nr:cytochrome c biogenesis protein [Methanothrix harundinacea]